MRLSFLVVAKINAVVVNAEGPDEGLDEMTGVWRKRNPIVTMAHKDNIA